ncbi:MULTISPECIES: hypothetical protein [unclassified Rhodococcus (in: high G+C Gram-positive bacteria)]|uniref:hypothetical protein n=1 Tax=unclassified Rhodococcus (in: high G+C Gram-positive bacteria) TaxID=192944 RepID=UPI00163A85D4|nr:MULTISPECIES: hypothetical protein [unclassified Rhodococcus (in: high G+C Gram-positive bacteria)]MBC2642862.1 hypothetical protein [Rhodococcus sp. 3A]MBC2892396.1 hypothetical protein [Rhodococcus sp. 4CII]
MAVAPDDVQTVRVLEGTRFIAAWSMSPRTADPPNRTYALYLRPRKDTHLLLPNAAEEETC